MHNNRRMTWLALVSAGAVLSAAPINKDKARQIIQAVGGTGVTGYAKEAGQEGPLGAKTVLYYIGKLNSDKGSGFVAVPADDQLPPIMAFSTENAFDGSRNAPFKTFMARDLEIRLASLWNKNRQVSKDEVASCAANSAAWEALLSGSRQARSLRAWVSDMRVSPLMSSRWKQAKVGDRDVYNLFTPEVSDADGSGEMTHTPCGTAATAMAQMMRFHQWPKAGIGVKTFTCSVEGEERELGTRGGDGDGGAYQWSQMPVKPTDAITDAQAEMIGALCSDAGVALGMNYKAQGSVADLSLWAGALKNTFRFSNAIADFDNNESLTAKSDFYRKVNANLDARLPVLMGLLGSSGQGAVCDGYGYTDKGVQYHHLNLGCEGTSTVWYHLAKPGVASGAYPHESISRLVYNITRSGRGECIGGRVLEDGLPVQGVRITLEGASRSVNTDKYGVFGFAGVKAGKYKIRAEKSGLSFPLANAVVGSSVDNGNTGNVWPLVIHSKAVVDELIITEQPQSFTIGNGGSATLRVGVKGTGSFSYQWYRGESGDTANPVNGTKNTYTTPQLFETASYWVRVSNGSRSVDSDTATVTVEDSTPTGPIILSQPKDVTIKTGQTATLTVEAKGKKMRFDWYLGESGDTSRPVKKNGGDSYTTAALTASTFYWVRITDGNGDYIDSDTATVTVEGNDPSPAGPVIEKQPQDVTIKSGQTVTLTVVAKGKKMKFDWYLGESGDTSRPVKKNGGDSYTTAALTASTFYWVRITDGDGEYIDSDTVTVTVR